jgi:hypothetical protein
LGAGAIDGRLGAEKVLVEHGVAGGLFGECSFDFGASAEPPGGADHFCGKHFLQRAVRAHVVPEGAGEGFVFFRFVRLDAVLCGEQAEAGGVLGGAVAAFRGAGAG